MKKPIRNQSEHPLHDINAAIGSAITGWQHVEFQMARVLLALITNDEKYRAANAAINSVMSLRDRISMTDIAVEISLDSDLAKEWKNISDKIKKRSSKRNAFAHYVLVQEFDEGETDIEFYYSLQPNVFDSGRKIKHRGKIPKLVLADIRAQGLAFNELADIVGKFAHRITP